MLNFYDDAQSFLNDLQSLKKNDLLVNCINSPWILKSLHFPSLAQLNVSILVTLLSRRHTLPAGDRVHGGGSFPKTVLQNLKCEWNWKFNCTFTICVNGIFILHSRSCCTCAGPGRASLSPLGSPRFQIPPGSFSPLYLSPHSVK